MMSFSFQGLQYTFRTFISMQFCTNDQMPAMCTNGKIPDTCPKLQDVQSTLLVRLQHIQHPFCLAGVLGHFHFVAHPAVQPLNLFIDLCRLAQVA